MPRFSPDEEIELKYIEKAKESPGILDGIIRLYYRGPVSDARKIRDKIKEVIGEE